jgi:hypothetical protein
VGELHLPKIVVSVSAEYSSHGLRVVKTGRVFPSIEVASSSLLRGGQEEWLLVDFSLMLVDSTLGLALVYGGTLRAAKSLKSLAEP